MTLQLFTQSQVEALALEAGFIPANARIAAAIAMCEAPYMSGGVAHSNFSAEGDQTLADDVWGHSWGGMQIRSLRADAGTGRTRDAERLIDPLFNMRSARTIKLNAGSWRPWSTYTSGMYKAYLRDATGAIKFPPPPGSYTPVAGDSLSKIGAKKGIDWRDLARWNGLHAPFLVRIGDVILLSDPGVGT